MEEYFKKNKTDKGIILETAHPVKFEEVVKKVIHHQVELPIAMEYLFELNKKSTIIKPEFDELKNFLLRGQTKP